MRREKHGFLAAIAAVALTMPALAQAQGGGGYFGLSTGATKAKQWCDPSALPAGASLAACNRRDKGWKMFAGYRVYRVLAFEASFIDFGKRSLTATAGAESPTVTARASAFSADAVVMIPLWRLEVFGKAGIAKVKAQSNDTPLAGSTFKLGKNDNEAHYGLGLNYRFSGEWDVRGEWERIKDSKIDFFSIGLQYRY
jgi:OmpA-OmpF porin, OOP family